MKNILCLLIILFVGIGVYAQEKVLTAAQFDALYKGSSDAWSLENWKGKAFRLVTLTESKLEGRPQTDFASKWTVEYASLTSSRMVYETTFGNTKSKTESIRIGEKLYSRTADGDWKESPSRTSPVPAAKTETEAKSVTEQVEYKFLGAEKLNDRNVKVYVKNVSSKRVNPAGGAESTTTSVTKYWFSEDGVILKSEMVSETREGEKTYRTLLTQIWEADETIKIFAPTLNVAQKQ